MHIKIGSAQISALDVRIAGVPPFMEIRLSGTELIISNSPDGKLWVRSATGSIVITEAAMNSSIAATRVDRIRDLDLKTYNGFVRISGRHELVGAVTIPFTVTATPEIESGMRLRLALKDVNVAGALPMPGFLVQMLAAKINEQLGQTFDSTRLPVPIRLTGVNVEPGRLTLSVSLEMPAESAPPEDEAEDGGRARTTSPALLTSAQG